MRQSKTNIAWYITIGVFILHFLPYLIYPGDAYIRIHDTLEGEWIWLDILDKSNTALNFNPDTKIDQVMNGIPRSAMPTGVSMMMLFVNIFGTYWGYVINYMLVHLVGFAAMYFFLRTHIFKKDDDKSLVIYISLIFSLIPVYTPFGLSVMSQPTLIHIFILALKHKAKYYHYLLLLLFPLYSSLVWMGMPLLMLLGLFWIYKLIKYRRSFPQYMVGLAILSISYALVNFNLFQLIFDPPAGFVSHRSAYNLYMFESPQLGTAIVDFAHQFFTLHYHVGTMLTLPILILAIIVYNRRHPLFKKLFILILSIVLLQAFYSYFEFYMGNHIEVVKSFRLNRFNIVLPVIWIAGFALIIREMQLSEFLKKLIPISLITMLITTWIGNDEILNNYRRMAGGYHLPSFKEYMLPEQFAQIKQTIGDNPKNYRVACIGMNPGILQYNGFYTLDGLQSVYDLNYKQTFRTIFTAELDKNQEIKGYFDGWGNRCYIFSSELGKDWISTHDHEIQLPLEVGLNALAFKKLGGRYIITPFECKFGIIMVKEHQYDYEYEEFILVKKFDFPESQKKLYLYEVQIIQGIP